MVLKHRQSYVRPLIVLTIIFQKKSSYGAFLFRAFLLGVGCECVCVGGGGQKSNLKSGQLYNLRILNPKRDFPALVTRGVEFQMLN